MPGIAVEEIEPGRVGGGVGLLDGDAFGREPGVGRPGRDRTRCLDAAQSPAAVSADGLTPYSTFVKSGIRLIRAAS